MKSKFLSISIGITLMLFGTGFLIRSVQPAEAAPTPTEFVEGASTTGKYQIAVAGNSTSEQMTAIIINTETGQTATYWRNGTFSSWGKMSNQIPSSPM